jgi:hypothetical protein
MTPPQKILAAFVEETGTGRVVENIVIANSAMVTKPNPDTVEGRMLRVLDEFGPVMDGEEFAEKCVAVGVNATSFYIYRLISPVIVALGNGVYCKVGTEVAPGVIEEIAGKRRAIPRTSDHGWMPNGNIWFGFELSRAVMTTGGVRIATFVADLVQGEWQVQLPDGRNYGNVTCRNAFIWSFRKAFLVLGVEPDELVALEFDRKSKNVLVRAGGPGLFETIQSVEPLDIEDEKEHEANICQ